MMETPPLRTPSGSAPLRPVVMLVSNRYDPDPRVHKEACSLAAAGHVVHVLAWDREHELPESECRDGVYVERLRVWRARLGDLAATALGLVSFRRAARRRIRELAPRVVHCHDHDTCAVGLWWKRKGARCSGVRRPRFVFDAHDLYWTWLRIGHRSSLWRSGVSRVLEAEDRYFARRADLLITVTERRGAYPGLAEIYRDWGCEPLVILNAPPRSEGAPALPGRFTVGYFGTIREVAMFHWLTEAVSRLAPERRPSLRLAGGGVAASAVAEHLERFGRGSGVDVKVQGRFTLSDIPTLLADVSVQYCLYPTRGNMDRALPVKLLESVAARRPVIANALSLMEPWVEQHRWGWCVPEGDVEALAQALESAYRWHAGARRPVLISPPFWEEQGAKLVAAYERLLA